MFQIPCAVLSVRGMDILRSTACLKQFVYPVTRRHIVLLSSPHHIASTVMVLMVQSLVTSRNFRWRGKSRRLGPQIWCHSRRLAIVTRPSTRSIFHAVLFQLSRPPIVPPPFLRLHDLLVIVFIVRFFQPYLLVFRIKAHSFLK